MQPLHSIKVRPINDEQELEDSPTCTGRTPLQQKHNPRSEQDESPTHRKWTSDPNIPLGASQVVHLLELQSSIINL